MFSLGTLAWLVCTIWVSLGALFVSYPSLTPSLILHLYVYGKIRKTDNIKKDDNKYLLPKSYFSHFYFSGVICITSSLLMSLYVTCGGGQWPNFVHKIVTIMRYPEPESYGDMFSNIVVLACASCQVLRRFQECLFISVYSPDSKMSFVIYFVGVAFYTALPITSLSGTNLDDIFKCGELLQYVCWNHIVGLVMFIWASYQQRRVAIQFAQLRQNKSGRVQNTKHHIPYGGLFDYVSCPHYFTEILIYLSMNIIFSFRNTMMVSLFVFVLANQIITGHFSHKWYKETFRDYPKNRKSTIPFLI